MSHSDAPDARVRSHAESRPREHRGIGVVRPDFAEWARACTLLIPGLVNEREKDSELELTPTCDPPVRLAESGPIGSSWWIEPSHPEIDPRSGVPVNAAPEDAPTKPTRTTASDS